MRHVRRSIGPCARALVDELLQVPRLQLVRASSKGERRWRIGIHVRRGDACERWATPSLGRSRCCCIHSGHLMTLADLFVAGEASRRPWGHERDDGRRPCYGAQTYLSAARALLQILHARGRQQAGRRLMEIGSNVFPPLLLVATDSPAAIVELKSLCMGGAA